MARNLYTYSFGREFYILKVLIIFGMTGNIVANRNLKLLLKFVTFLLLAFWKWCSFLISVLASFGYHFVCRYQREPCLWESRNGWWSCFLWSWRWNVSDRLLSLSLPSCSVVETLPTNLSRDFNFKMRSRNTIFPLKSSIFSTSYHWGSKVPSGATTSCSWGYR